MSRGRQAAPPKRDSGARPAAAPRDPDGAPRRNANGTGTPLAALVSAVGLLVIVIGSFVLLSSYGFNPAGATPNPNDTGPLPSGVQLKTPNASIVLTPPPDKRPTIAGTLLFARQGNIWAASGLDITAVAQLGSDSSPAWSPDGQSIYAIETKLKTEVEPPFSGGKMYFNVTNIARMNADGSNRSEIFKSLFNVSGGQWYTGVYQPDVSPDGKTLALVSDYGYVPVNGCEACYQPVVVGTMTAQGTKLTNLEVKSSNNLGHNDPDWSPDGKKIAFTYNQRDGSDGAPRLGILTVASKQVQLLRKGYANPSWSPDGSMLAAERTTSTGRDVVIVSPSGGAELARLTNDGDSFAPVWSPNGDQLAFLHRHGSGMDLMIMTLKFDASGITLVETKPVTEDGSLDASSPPAWFIPTDQRKPLPTPPSIVPSAGPSETP